MSGEVVWPKRLTARCSHTMRVTGRDGITRCGDCGKTLKATPAGRLALNLSKTEETGGSDG